jgi:hypothetical protein
LEDLKSRDWAWRGLRPHLPEFQSACLAPPAVAAEHEHSFVVKLTIFIGLDVQVFPGA